MVKNTQNIRYIHKTKAYIYNAVSVNKMPYRNIICKLHITNDI